MESNKPMAGAHLSDTQVAGAVRMLMRDQLDHEAVCLVARDRIMSLAAERDQLRAEVERLQRALDVRGEIVTSQNLERERIVVEAQANCDALTARAEASEKDAAACRAEYRELFAKAGAMSDKLIAAESTAAGLRRALEELIASAECIRHWHDTGENGEGMIVSNAKVHELWAETDKARTALAASPDDHERRLKSEALEEFRKAISQEAAFIGCSLVTKEALRDLAEQVTTDEARQALLAEADRLEAANAKQQG